MPCAGEAQLTEGHTAQLLLGLPEEERLQFLMVYDQPTLDKMMNERLANGASVYTVGNEVLTETLTLWRESQDRAAREKAELDAKDANWEGEWVEFVDVSFLQILRLVG